MTASGGTSRFVDSGGVAIHVVDSVDSADPGLTPVLFVPGLSDMASEYGPLIEELHPRRTVVVDLRGRGRSGSPDAGYRLEDLSGDVEAAAAGLGPVHLATFSRGTSAALAWAAAHAGRVRAIAIGDYQAQEVGLPEQWPAWWMKTSWRGRPMVERMRPATAEGIQRDSVSRPLWDRLAALPVPGLVMVAGEPGPRGHRLVDETALARFGESLAQLQVEVFDGCGHDLFDPDPRRYGRVLRAFLAGVEGA